jgi:hypothetical protein
MVDSDGKEGDKEDFELTLKDSTDGSGRYVRKERNEFRIH